MIFLLSEAFALFPISSSVLIFNRSGMVKCPIFITYFDVLLQLILLYWSVVIASFYCSLKELGFLTRVFIL